MNIIFGKENADRVEDKYTVLELDTVQVGEHGPAITAYCVVENMKFDEIPMIESMQALHQDLVTKYQSRNWTTCLQIIKRLRGFWNGELDSYYDTLELRIQQLLEQLPDDSWTPVIQK